MTKRFQLEHILKDIEEATCEGPLLLWYMHNCTVKWISSFTIFAHTYIS